MSNTGRITPADVIASHDKYGDKVLVPDLKKLRDMRTINPKAKFDVAYIPFGIQLVSGKVVKLIMDFECQLAASTAKPPGNGEDDGAAVKHLQIIFTHLDREKIEGGDYVPRTRDTPEKQVIENKRVASNIDDMMVANELMLKALAIIDRSYITMCDDLIAKEASLPFKLKKDRNAPFIVKHRFVRENFQDKETGEIKQLEHPNYYLKIPVNKTDGRVGTFNNFTKEFQPSVFDARRMSKTASGANIPAATLVDGKYKDLDVAAAPSFITYKSLLDGALQFESICVHKSGLSIVQTFPSLYVFTHKSKKATATISNDRLKRMRGGISDDECSDNDAVQDNEHNSGDTSVRGNAAKTNPMSAPIDSDEEDAVEVLDEADPESESEEAQVIVVPKKKAPARPRAPKK